MKKKRGQNSNELSPLLISTKSTTNGSSSNLYDNFNLYDEVKTMLEIAIPTIILQFSTYFIYPQCASAVGKHLDGESLAAFSLGSVSGNMTCISIIIGTLSANETLQPRAFGLKRYREVGRLAIRGFIMCVLSLVIPVTALMTKLDNILPLLGQDADVSLLTMEWMRVYLWSVPPLLLFRVIQRFLACQNIVMPCTFGGVISCLVIHPLVLNFAIQSFGILGSGWAVVFTTFMQLILCIGYIVVTGSYDKRTWPGLSTSIILETFDIREIITFAKLSLGGIFALSEWWFWECICFVAGNFGIVELCVHTVAYQLIPIFFMLPLGISIGLSVRIGILLPVNVDGAKKLAVATMILSIFVSVIISAIIYKNQTWIVSMFTSDENVFEGCQRIWLRLCVYLVIINIFGVSTGVLSALGLQWRTFANMFVVLWLWGIPAIIYFCIFGGKGYYCMWDIIPILYILLDIGLVLTYVTADWNEIGAQIEIDQSKKEGKEETLD